MATISEDVFGGERGIRTLGTLTRTHAFQACPFDRSGTSPVLIPSKVHKSTLVSLIIQLKPIRGESYGGLMWFLVRLFIIIAK